ncbi:MAG: hypothetical protein ACKO0Z_25245 [Betaproteobacteria bacterium]
MAIDTTLTLTPYKGWKATAPVGSGSFGTLNVTGEKVKLASASLTGDINVRVENYDTQSVDISVEMVSSYGAALFNNLWGSGASSGGVGGSTNISISRTGTNVTVVSSSGDDGTIGAASDTQAGVMTAAMKAKLDGIEAGAQVNPTGAAIVTAINSQLGSTDWQAGSSAINLGTTPSATEVVITNSGGDDATLTGATGTNAGLLVAADKSKLDAIESGATADQTDAEIVALVGDLLGAKGSFVENPGVTVSSNGTTVSVTVDPANIVFPDAYYSYAGSSVNLTAGTNASPTLNYVYVTAAGTLTASTTGWPAATHAPVATVLVPSAALTQTEGPYTVTLTESATIGAANDGKLEELSKTLKRTSKWVSGMAHTLTVTVNNSDDDDIDIALAAGVFERGRNIAFPSRTTLGADSFYIYNSSAAAYTKVGSLKTALKTSASGGSITAGQYASFVIWALTSEVSAYNKIMINLPTAFYKSEKDAIADAKLYTDYSLGSAVAGNAVPIARIVLVYGSDLGGSWTLVSTQDLRGKSFSELANQSLPSREFLDDDFKLRDGTDTTKALSFQLSSISTGTERTLTAPDSSGTLTLLEVAQTFAAGAKKTFSHDSTNAGLKIAAVAGDPSTQEDGDIWYNLTTGKFRKRQNGVTENLDTQGSAAPGGSDNQFTYNDGGTFGGSSGLTYNEANSRPVVPNGIELSEVATPSAPGTDKAVLFLRDRGIGKAFPTIIDQYGDLYPLGNSAMHVKTFGILKARANSGTPADLFHGITAINNGSAIDVTTGTYGRRHKMAYTSVAATLNSSAGFRAGIRSFFREGGFYWRCRWSPSTAHDTLSGQTRGFWGVANSTAALSGATDFSAQVNFIGFGWDAGQTTLRAGCNDGTGTATTTDLGANFPINTVDTDVYDVALFCDPADTTQVFYYVERINTGHTASGTFTTNLPATTTGLGAQGWSSQGNQSATAIVCHFYWSYWELPY